MENIIEQLKTCIKCQTTKAAEHFHKDIKTKDGLNSICKKCRSTKKPSIINLSNTKICKKCKIEKPLEEFQKRETSKDGYRHDCKDCRYKYNKEYKHKNWEKFSKYHLEYGRKHRPQNKEKYREYVKIYRIRYPERRREQDKKRRQIPQFRVKSNLRGRLRDILRKQGTVKSNKTMNLIGCSIEYLMTYLQSLFYDRQNGEKMTLELMSTPIIELDHIIPLWKFDLSNPEQQKIGFHYTNMRPMWAEDHNIKSAKDYVEYCAWKRSGLTLNEYLKNPNIV